MGLYRGSWELGVPLGALVVTSLGPSEPMSTVDGRMCCGTTARGFTPTSGCHMGRERARWWEAGRARGVGEGRGGGFTGLTPLRLRVPPSVTLDGRGKGLCVSVPSVAVAMPARDARLMAMPLIANSPLLAGAPTERRPPRPHSASEELSTWGTLFRGRKRHSASVGGEGAHCSSAVMIAES